MKRIGAMLLGFILILAIIPARTQAVEMDLAVNSAVLMDVATGTLLYEQNAHEPLAPASVT